MATALFLVLVLVGMAFYRPILRYVLREAAIGLAATENLDLTLELDGDFFTHFSIRNLEARATGPSPLDFAKVGYFDVHYNIWDLIREGKSNLISSYRVEDVDMEVSPVKATQTQKVKFANLLRNILEQPALFTDNVAAKRINLVVQQPEGNLVVRNATVTLHPSEEGVLQADEVSVPKYGSWSGIDAKTTYRDRHLAVSGLRLGDDVNVSQVVLDSSRRAEGVHYLSFRGTVLDGEVAFFLWRQQSEEEDYAQVTAAVRGLPIGKLRDFLQLKPEMEGVVEAAWVQVGGSPDLPQTWRGDATLVLTGGVMSRVDVGDLRAAVSIHNGVAQLHRTEITTGANRLALASEYQLPESSADLFTDGFEAKLEFEIPEPRRFYPAFTGGELEGEGVFTIDDQLARLTVKGTLERLAAKAGEQSYGVEKGESEFVLKYRLEERPEGSPWFRGMVMETKTALSGISVGPWKIDRSRVEARMEEGELKVSRATIEQGENEATLHAAMKLPQGAFTVDALAGEAGFEVKIPSLAAMQAEPEGEGVVRGVVSASGRFEKKAGETIRGESRLEATQLGFREFKAERFEIVVPVEENVAKITTLRLDLPGGDQVNGTGQVELAEPFAYQGEVSGKLSDLSIFSPLLGRPLSGAVQLNWKGSGQLRTLLRQEGEVNFSLQNGSVAEMSGLSVEIAGNYSPEKIEVPTLRVIADQGSLQGSLFLREQRLYLNDLRIGIGKEGVIAGSLAVPLDLRTPDQPETILPAAGALEGKLVLERVAVEKLLAGVQKIAPKKEVEGKAVRQPEKRVSAKPTARRRAVEEPQGPPLTGFLDASLTLGGRVEAPEATLTLAGRELRARAAERLAPSSFDAALRFHEDRLKLEGNVAVPGLKPLVFNGDLPLPLQKLREEKKLDPQTPVRMSVRLPNSSAAILSRYFPAIRYLEGEIGVDASVSGTVEKPVFKGGLMANIPAIRFANSNLPGISGFRADLAFADDALTFRRFEGAGAGGPFRLSGKIGLADPANPQMDLLFQSTGSLLARNDSLTVRADANIRIKGPLREAEVSGSVGINRSRFFRDIEILPIGLPSDPAPQRTAQGPMTAPSITAAPIRDWKFAIAIKTTEPFIIRSNMANGEVHADLRFGGTGLAPTLEGTASIRKFVASLPFSSLAVDYGYVYFTAGEPFNPVFDIHGTSRLRNYQIHAYIYGTAENPETVFTSEPPLPQEEIVTLLATGATSDEFAGNSELLASRAAFLLLQDLYRKAFRRKSPPPASAEKPNDFADRFTFDAGSVDPRTGRQQLGGAFRVTDQVEIGAGLDLEGDVRGEVRYLIRFR